MDDDELTLIEVDLRDTLNVLGLGWIDAEVSQLLNDDPEHRALRAEASESEGRVVRVLFLLEAIQRTAQTVVACDLELTAAQERHEAAEPWRGSREDDEPREIVPSQLNETSGERLVAVRELVVAVADLQSDLLAEVDVPLRLEESTRDQVEASIRRETAVTQVWSDAPALRLASRHAIDPRG